MGANPSIMNRRGKKMGVVRKKKSLPLTIVRIFKKMKDSM